MSTLENKRRVFSNWWRISAKHTIPRNVYFHKQPLREEARNIDPWKGTASFRRRSACVMSTIQLPPLILITHAVQK